MQTIAVIWLMVFLGGYIAIYLLADLIIDALENLSQSFAISPIVLGLLVLGIDVEESIVSLVAAVDGLPYLSLGQLIGNTVIAIAIAFGVPALFLRIEVDQLPRFYYAELVIAGIVVLVSMVLTSYLIVFGLLAIALFVIHLRHTFHIQREFRSAVRSPERFELTPNLEREKCTGEKSEGRARFVIKLLLALLAVFVSGEVLVVSAEELVVLTGLSETFFGLVIMAAVTNVEEFWLIVKAVQKGQTALGVSAQVGKIIWNTTLIFGLCSLFLFQFTFEMIMLTSSIIFVFALVVLVVNLTQNRSSRATGIGYLLILLIFLAINSLGFLIG
ncbi:MAG: hypothetical protein C4K48_12920 [Candidatus Thorarchaeota archaeon]|nr:MAG: hypothetical protein C4K48_12920 [Candidatus Thorarchaeota archaeon]